MDELLEEFKEVYKEKGAHDFQSQIKYLSALADHYHQLGADNSDWVCLLKAHALYNSVATRDKENQETWSAKAYEVQRTYWGKKAPQLSSEQQREITDRVRRELLQVRTSTQAELNDITSNLIDLDCKEENLALECHVNLFHNFMADMEDVSKHCSNGMVKVFNLIIRMAVEIIGDSPCNFCTAALGSLARGEATPYSDLEFLFLIKNKSPEITTYFEDLAITIYFVIGNLQETKLRYMAIEELSDWFDDVATNGLKIDGLQKWAGNIPTGNGQSGQHNHFICTVEELVSRYKDVYNNPDPKESIRGDITAMLSSTVFIYGDSDLLEQFSSNVQCLKPTKKRQAATIKMMANDIQKYNFYPNGSLSKTLNLKSDIYRYPSMLTLNLSLMHGTGKTSFSAITDLASRNVLSKSIAYHLRFTFCCALYIRLSAYLYHESQDERISVLGSNPDHAATKDQWSISRPLLLHMLIMLMPLKDVVVKGELHKSLESTNITAKYSVALVSYLCGDSQRCYDVLKELDPHHEERDITRRDMQTFCADYLHLYTEVEQLIRGTIQFLLEAPDPLSLRPYLLPHYYIQLGTVCARQGKYNEATSYHNIAIKRFSANHVPNSSLEPIIYTELGLVQKLQGNYETAEQYYQQSIEMSLNRPNGSDNYASTLDAYVKLSDVYWSRGEFDKCEMGYIKSLDYCFKIYGHSADHSQIAETYGDLCETYYWWGKFQKAVEYGIKSLEMNERLSGDRENMELAVSLSRLGSAYSFLDQSRKAESLLTKSLEMMRRIVGGSDHELIENVLDRLGSVYQKFGDLGKAENLYKQSINMARRLYGDSHHPSKAIHYTNLGCLYLVTGDCSKAEIYHKKSLETRRLLGRNDDDPGVALCFMNLATVQMQKKDYGEAEKYYRHALKLMRPLYKSSDHLNIASCCRGLTHCYSITLRFGAAFHFALTGLNMALRLYNSDLDGDVIQAHYHHLAGAYLTVRYYISS